MRNLFIASVTAVAAFSVEEDSVSAVKTAE